MAQTGIQNIIKILEDPQKLIEVLIDRRIFKRNQQF